MFMVDVSDAGRVALKVTSKSLWWFHDIHTLERNFTTLHYTTVKYVEHDERVCQSNVTYPHTSARA